MNKDFANYCCELLQSAGPCVSKRMFGGSGISVDGLTIALIADLGGGEKLWLKASDETRAQFEAAGGARFTYEMTRNGITAPRGMNYYSAPEEAMDSPDAMQPWARLALDCALQAKLAKPAKSKPPQAHAKSRQASPPLKPLSHAPLVAFSVRRLDQLICYLINSKKAILSGGQRRILIENRQKMRFCENKLTWELIIKSKFTITMWSIQRASP